MTVWFTSDPHWDHAWVAHLRGFGNGGPEDRAKHDLTLLENFQSMVKEGDQVWWLGDLSMGNPEYALQMTASIPGEHHLITGNHDACNPMHRDSHKWQRKYLEVFKSVQAYARRRVPDPTGEGYWEALLSHYPYWGGDPFDVGGSDHGDVVRHTQWRLPDEGKFLIHGHTHAKDQRLHGDDFRQLHVGLDAHDMKPVSLEYVSEAFHMRRTILWARKQEAEREHREKGA